MGKFQNALKKAISKRDCHKPKAKHLQSNSNSGLESNFEELPFPKTAEFLQKTIADKKPYPRLRALMVIHFLINKKKQDAITWFNTLDVQIDYLPNHTQLPLTSNYYFYLKQKCRSLPTILLFLSPVLLDNIKQNSEDLLKKTEELISLGQSLISMKEQLIQLLRNKALDNISPEICTWVLADSQIIYNSLKIAVGCLWQLFTGFESYTANRAREIFIRYNNFVAQLKEFAEKCPEEYPGAIPSFSALSEKTMSQIDVQIKGKENLGMSKNLLKFEPIEKDGSPAKKRNNFSMDFGIDMPKSNEGVRNSLNFSTNQPRGNGFNPLGMYPPNMVYPSQQFYYQPFPQYRP